MKKLVKYFVAIVAIVGIAAIGLVGCVANPGPPAKKPVLAKKSNVVAVSAASSVNMLSSLSQGTSPKTLSMAAAAAADPAPAPAPADKKELTEEEINEIDKQVKMFDTFVGSNPMNVTNEKSDKAEYTHKMVIALKDIAGTSTQYLLYYNITKEGAEDPAPVADKAAEEDKDEDDGMSDEQSFKMTGIMIFGDVTYTLDGENETEEGEYEMTLKASIDEKNYIIIEQETEAEEQELNYQIFKDGVKVSAFGLEMENEEDEMSVKIKSLENGVKVVRSLERETEDGKTILKIKQKEGDKTFEAKIYITVDANGKEVYTYKLPSGKTFEKAQTK
ncbi:MAG: hypothetical protein RR416_00495 [Clostridia bacterium]